MILLIDNYDSFTFNLQRYLALWEQRVSVLRNDHADLLREDLAERYAAIVLSPGPCGPASAGHCLTVVKRWTGQLPILGVCLGHQVICEAFGAHIQRAVKPMHGAGSPMNLQSCALFDGIPDRSTFARYHSLVAQADSLPPALRVIATSDQQEVMAVQHCQHRTLGVQFHPESILSNWGHRLLGNFLKLSGLECAADEPPSDLRPALPDEVPAHVLAAADQGPAIAAPPPTVLPRRFSPKPEML